MAFDPLTYEVGFDGSNGGIKLTFDDLVPNLKILEDLSCGIHRVRRPTFFEQQAVKADVALCLIYLLNQTKQ